MKIKGLYCILPEFDTFDEYINFTKKLLKFQPDVIQLRIKRHSDKFFYMVAKDIKKIISFKKIPFIIDDRVDIALMVKANGVHLGQDDIPVDKLKKFLLEFKFHKLIVGFSTHSLEQAKLAMKLPVDYISIGPVFPTETKDYKPIGVDVVKKVVDLVNNLKPVVAIGGINEKNVDLLKDVKPTAIAVISVLNKTDLSKVILKLKSIF